MFWRNLTESYKWRQQVHLKNWYLLCQTALHHIPGASSFQTHMEAMIHVPAIPCRWIIITILQLLQNFCSSNSHCVGSIKISRREINAQHSCPVCVVKYCWKACDSDVNTPHCWLQTVIKRQKQTETHVWAIIIIIWVIAMRKIYYWKQMIRGMYIVVISPVIYRRNVGWKVDHLIFRVE